jgi:hypothetical protein
VAKRNQYECARAALWHEWNEDPETDAAEVALRVLARRVKRLTPAPASEYAGRVLLEESDVLALLERPAPDRSGR